MKAFETWKFAGKRFLAVPYGSNVHVLDEDGGWYSVESFREHQRGKSQPTLLSSQASLVVRTLPQ